MSAIDVTEALESETERIHDPHRVVLDDQIGLRRELQEKIKTPPGLGVHTEAPFGAIGRGEGWRVLPTGLKPDEIGIRA